MRDVEGAISWQLAEYASGRSRIESYCRSWTGPVDVRGKGGEDHYLQLTFPTPQAASGCFPERWGPHRYEPIGNLFLLPARELFHARSECRRQRSISCLISPGSIKEWFGAEWNLSERQLQAGLNIVNPTIKLLLTRLGEEIRNPGFASETLSEALSIEIAVELSRYFLHFDESPNVGGLAPWRLRLIDERLAEAANSPSLGELARLCNISVRHLTRGFRASRGFSIGSHIAASRIEYAKRLLNSDLGVKSVAYAMGFSAPCNFSAAFRRATGQTPREYRQSSGRDHAAQDGISEAEAMDV